MNNLQTMVKALLGLHFTGGSLGASVGASQSTINRISLGGSTSYGVGKAIEALYAEHFPDGSGCPVLSDAAESQCGAAGGG